MAGREARNAERRLWECCCVGEMATTAQPDGLLCPLLLLGPNEPVKGECNLQLSAEATDSYE
jgi:hypothetical protein